MNTASERLAEALADRYRIERELGVGGMATVYLAHDLKHDRPVAVKVLHPELGAVLGADRFLTEIRTTANLQHPNILPLFDSGEAAGQVFYVMPFVAGETLRDRLRREGQLGIDDAVRLAQGVASALDYAHRHGVVHRDVKPENILLQDGQAMVADFGVALAISSAGGARITQTGISVGTPQYMSPEQAAAERQLDGRSDQYSLAAVVYEMLSGEPPFTGPSAPAILTKLMTEPVAPLESRRAAVPPALAAAVHRALQKVPADRFPSAAEFGAALATEGSVSRRFVAPTVRSRWREGAAWIGLVGIVAAWAIWDWGGPADPGSSSLVRFTVELPAGYRLVEADPATSPDGRLVAFVAESAGVSRILVRDLARDEIRPVSRTEGVVGDPCPPFFSPDGQWIAFVVGRTVRKVQVGRENGLVADIAGFGGSETLHGGDWGDDGWIVFGAGIARGLVRVRQDGGTLESLIEPDRKRGEISYRRPNVLPDGRGILVAVQSTDGFSVAVVANDGRTPPRVLLRGATSAEFYAPRHIVFSRPDGLFVSEFDPSRLALIGAPTLVAAQLPLLDWGGGHFPSYSTSPVGLLAVVTQPADEARSISRWTNRLALVEPGGDIEILSETSDGTIGFSSRGDAIVTYDSVQITRYDLARGGLRSRLTSGPAHVLPIFTPDGARIVYTSYESGAGDIYWMSARDGSDKRLIITSERRKYPEAISPDGRILVYREYDPTTVDDVWMVPLDGSAAPVPLIRTGSREYGSAISPDGTLIAFTSNRSGRAEVYVRPFPDTSAAGERVSVNGAAGAAWHPSGTGLFFLEQGDIMFAGIARVGGGIRVGPPRRILDTEATYFAVGPDGRRFAVILPPPRPPVRSLTVMVNWRPD